MIDSASSSRNLPRTVGAILARGSGENCGGWKPGLLSVAVADVVAGAEALDELEMLDEHEADTVSVT